MSEKIKMFKKVRIVILKFLNHAFWAFLSKSLMKDGILIEVRK